MTVSPPNAVPSSRHGFTLSIGRDAALKLDAPGASRRGPPSCVPRAPALKPTLLPTARLIHQSAARSGITTDLLATLLRARPGTLVLDVRSPRAFVDLRIDGSFNVCVPDKLLKRPSWGIEKVLSVVGAGTREAVVHAMRVNMDPVICIVDEIVGGTGNPGKGPTARAVLLLNKIADELSGRGTIGYFAGPLTGGGGFCGAHPDLCVKGAPVPAADGASLELSLSLKVGSSKHLVSPVELRLADSWDSPADLPALIARLGSCRVPPFLTALFRTPNVGDEVGRRFAGVDAEGGEHGGWAIGRRFDADRVVDNYFCAAKGPSSPDKNRYLSVWPYDHNRVKLPERPFASDYINASHITASASQDYIATQAPLPSTTLDFYRMLWDQNSRLIVMVTDEFDEAGSRLCDRYWPEAMGPAGAMKWEASDLVVEGVETEDLPSVPAAVRWLRVSDGAKCARRIALVQMFGWPDHGVPADGAAVVRLHHLVERVRRQIGADSSSGHASFPIVGPPSAAQRMSVVSKAPQSSPLSLASSIPICSTSHAPLSPPPPSRPNLTPRPSCSIPLGPTIVHCSAGAGRTGTFIAINSLLNATQDWSPTPVVSDSTLIPPSTTTTTTTPATTTIADPDKVADMVATLRRQRVRMVASVAQFGLIYEALLRGYAGLS
ncbi:protein-tyrosine phosphatase-like protein [Blyttiomyces helicus]|uniref:protein-tyrosine-phosphatase n=1 Tax=Blyttiomyces helicus TaxID=388810 RepID=A0A4P9W6P6_9FUNG|nr:protein-tyrosine phosphatase-like protein [Blyttiomyces helicus]|eukprot:RKO87682.1 protein-tyrosine phosphatase-like protein [Blyttiomyces helicus]